MSKKPSTKTKTQPHRNTQSKTKTSTARVAAPTSAPAAQGVPSPEITTFPPSDCTAGLPASESFHDLTFAELKRLNRTIDDLPYPIVWAEGDRREITKRVVQIIQNYPQANQLLAQRFSGSTIDAIRGVPVGRFMDPSLSDLKKTFAADVPVKDVTRLLDDKSVHAASLSRKPIPISLSDHSVADVLQARPTLVPARNNGKDVLLRLSSHKNTPTVPLQNEYVVRTADSFIRNPVVTSTNGLPVRVRMTGPQLQELSTIGRTRVSLGGHRIVIRTSDTGIPPGKTPAYAAYVSQSRGALEANDSTAYDQPFTEADPSTPTPSTPPIPSKPSQGALPLALYLPWQHRWVLKGYSRGELLHTLELGPQGEATLEISTWDRRKRTFEDSANSEFEQTTDFTDTSKDADSTAREINNQSELGINAGGEVGFKVSEFSVKGTNQNSIKANLANSSKNSLEFLRETVTKATNKLKLQRETKISETTEIGTENKVTRKERNPNLCHTLTLQYYEVLAHYEIITEFNKDDARLCLMDDNPIPCARLDAKASTRTVLRSSDDSPPGVEASAAASLARQSPWGMSSSSPATTTGSLMPAARLMKSNMKLKITSELRRASI
jgi:hypothetical protein